MLEIRNLHVEVEAKEILKGVNLIINKGEIHAIMGPNGSGKSTLCYVVMGHPKYKVTKGQILFNGQDITAMPVNERAKLGLFLAMQYPAEVQGVKMFDFLKESLATLQNKNRIRVDLFQKDLQRGLSMLEMKDEFAQRDLNDGFSGGEKKRSEILQLSLIKPKLALLDEIDSGLDVDGLRIVAEAIKANATDENGFLIITHYNRILNHILPHFVHIMQDGKIVRSGGLELAHEINEKGYSTKVRV
jgi:Fe-S cluster assembly ATP-binding protein